MKPRTDLLPVDALLAVSRVLGDGAAEHGERTWEAGRPAWKDYGAALRHLWAWWSGEDRCPSSGHPHLAHAAARVLILLALHLRGLERRETSTAPAPCDFPLISGRSRTAVAAKWLKDLTRRITLNHRVLGSSPSAPTNPFGGEIGLR